MKTVFGILLALLMVSLGLVTAPPVLAGTTIDVPGDYATIQEAIDAAGPGDTIVVAAGTYAAFQVVDKSNIHITATEGATVATQTCILIYR
jgi:pectin methylesterase-like acyl-CoA thioesterase